MPVTRAKYPRARRRAIVGALRSGDGEVREVEGREVRRGQTLKWCTSSEEHEPLPRILYHSRILCVRYSVRSVECSRGGVSRDAHGPQERLMWKVSSFAHGFRDGNRSTEVLGARPQIHSRPSRERCDPRGISGGRKRGGHLTHYGMRRGTPAQV